jgi:hypothetical protein
VAAKRQAGEWSINVSVFIEEATRIIWVRQQAGLPLQPLIM